MIDGNDPNDFISSFVNRAKSGNSNLRKIPEDPKEFIFKYAKTLDPHWEKKGMLPDANPFPSQYYIDPETKEKKEHYLSIITDVWKKEDSILVAKSRQLMVTWLFCALNLHLAITKKAQMIFFISKKEDDAGLKNRLSLCSRSKFVLEHLPKDMRPPVRQREKPPSLYFPETDSTIQGVSQDAEALRMYTASSIFSDEWAFQEQAETSYAALKPTIEGGGKIAGVSTPNGKQNLFYKLVHDKSAADEE